MIRFNRIEKLFFVGMGTLAINVLLYKIPEVSMT